jgi:hypothetical protein
MTVPPTRLTKPEDQLLTALVMAVGALLALLADAMADDGRPAAQRQALLGMLNSLTDLADAWAASVESDDDD